MKMGKFENGSKALFTFCGCDEDASRHDEETVIIVRPLVESDNWDPEVGPMYRVLPVAGGNSFDAFEDELTVAAA